MNPDAPSIVLATLNAKYIHASFGLRYLYANLAELKPRATIAEFDINQKPLDIAEQILRHDPGILGFGIYIWNTAQTKALIRIIRQLHPSTVIVLGGPEVSFETADQAIAQLADYVVTGEADLTFRGLCRELVAGRRPQQKILNSPLPTFDQLALPYENYGESDIRNRIIYLEASRGCPFSCEFCLSSLDIPVRQVELQRFLDSLRQLLDRGVRQFKFVDRTFNLNLNTSRAILTFLLENYQPGHFFHFEMVPDRLPEALREIIVRFPPGALQFEVGIQTFNPEVAERIQRRQDYARLEDNFKFLRQNTGVHLHADLIAGLPGETLESFAQGFDRLVALDPQEIQVGILKRLRGTPISRHSHEWQMVYSPIAPYEILQSRLIPFETMQQIRRFARYWDLISNSGNFVRSAPLLWQSADPALLQDSPFRAFLAFSKWLFAQTRRTDAIALPRLLELLFRYLTDERQHPKERIAATLWEDYSKTGRSDVPACIRPYLAKGPTARHERTRLRLPRRQARHGAG